MSGTIDLGVGVASVVGLVQVTVHDDGTIIVAFGPAHVDPGTARGGVSNPHRTAVFRVESRTATTSFVAPHQLPDHVTCHAPDAIARAIAWVLTGRGRP